MTSYRDSGRAALGTVLNKKQNICILEKAIYNTVINKYQKKQIDTTTDFAGVIDTEKNYKRGVYQVIGNIQQGHKLKGVLSDIKEGNIGWNNKCYDEMQKRMHEQNEFIQNPFEVEEGVLQCKAVLTNGSVCGSKRVFSYSLQARSADEGFNTYAQCVACKTKWVHKG